jgi:hypothetical protein
MKQRKESLVERLVDIKNRDNLLHGNDTSGPKLNSMELKVKELIDSVTLLCIFKNEDINGIEVSIPKRIIDDIEKSVKAFSPKIWEQVEAERNTYLKFVVSPEKIQKTKIESKKSLFGWFQK